MINIRMLHEAGQNSSERMKEIAIANMKEIMSRNAHISVDDIVVVGDIETGELQFKIPTSIRDRQIIYLLAYNMWFYGITAKELK